MLDMLDYIWTRSSILSRFTWETPCTTTKNTISSTRDLPVNNGSFRSSIAPILILAVQSAGVSRGRNGFQRDKSGEKLAESEEDMLEHRTDGSDAFDVLYIECEKFPFIDSFSVSMSGVL